MTRLFFKSISFVTLAIFSILIVSGCVPQSQSGNTANSAYDPFPQTSVTPDSYTGSYPSYCGYIANSNRQECIGYTSNSNTNNTGNTTSSNTSNSTNSTSTTNYNNSYPSYCSQSQYSYRQDCGGNGIPPTTTGYPSYCSDSTYSYLVACGGNGSATSTSSSYPSYCSNSANAHLTACGGNGTPTSTATSTTTYTTISTPSYCSNPQHSFRTECGGNGVQNTVTSSSSYPAYCTTPANSTRSECTGATTSNTTTSNSPAYCATPANSTRPECTGASTTTTGGNPTIFITPVNNTPTTTNRPAYCSTPANSTRPECTGATTNTSTNTGVNSAVNISGVWEGNLVNTENTLSVPTCMLLNDVNGQLTGQIYFRRSSALEYYGELQGSTQATASASSTGTFIKNTSLVVYYPDRTRTQFTGNFDSNNSFQSQYSYFDANGGTLTTGNSDLRKSNRSSCQ